MSSRLPVTRPRMSSVLSRAAAPVYSVAPGDVVAERYRVDAVLGRSRGLLLDARHVSFAQRVAIRLLPPALCDGRELERFGREARTLTKLESQHVARIIDVGRQADGAVYLVREMVEGVSLAEHLRQRGALSLGEAVGLFLQVAEAVQEVHANDVVLRDIGPEHIYVSKKRGGQLHAKIVDFGTVKALKEVSPEANGEMAMTTMVGFSPYVSPELLMQREGIDHRTDIWSLGCLLYEILTGQRPFQGEAAALCIAITHSEPRTVTSLCPGLPPELDQILGWALAKDRDDRFASVYAFAHTLRPYTSAQGAALIDAIGHLAVADDETNALWDDEETVAKDHFDPDATAIVAMPDISALPQVGAAQVGRTPAARPVMRYPAPPPPPRQEMTEVTGMPMSVLARQRRHNQRRTARTAVIISLGALVLLVGVALPVALAKRGVASPARLGLVPTASRIVNLHLGLSAPDDDEEPAPAPPASHDEPAPGPAPILRPPPAPTEPVPTATPTTVVVTPAPTTAPTVAPDTPGTIVAFATGNSCIWFLDGAPYPGSQVRAKVAPGPHTVTCKVATSSAVRTRTIDVKPGGVHTASF